MKLKAELMTELLEELKALPFVREVYVTPPKGGADIGLIIEGVGKETEHIHEINEVVNRVTAQSDNPEEWVWVYWEWHEKESGDATQTQD